METLRCQSCPLDLTFHWSLQVRKASTLTTSTHFSTCEERAWCMVVAYLLAEWDISRWSPQWIGCGTGNDTRSCAWSSNSK